MQPFRDRVQVSSTQKKEMQRYLGSLTTFTEETLFKIIRKMKEIERRIEEIENEIKFNR